MIIDPDHQFRLVMTIWSGNHRGEQPFYSAPQKNLLDVITLVRQIQANKALDSQVRSYKIQENVNPVTDWDERWHVLDYTDWCDL